MTCLEVQGFITPFMNHELTDERLEDFLNHIRHCDDCMEELEVYYILLTGMKELDEDKNLSEDLHEGFRLKIKRSEEFIRHRKMNTVKKRCLLILIVLVISIGSGISVMEITENIRSDVLVSHFTAPVFFKKPKILIYDSELAAKIDMFESQKRSERIANGE